MKIGMVSPYAWDVPGGVQAHIKDLAHYFQGAGHEVSVLAPALDEASVSEDFVVTAGRPVAIPFNGAVARVLFGPVAATRVRQWIHKNDFDVLHLHEPAIPSLSLLACSIAEGPMVGTFHVAAPRQKVAFAIAPLLEPVIEKLRARIAVSEVARETLTIHLDTDAVVIPNGITVDFFASAEPKAEWTKVLTIGFLGRFDEPRKGLELLLRALPGIAKSIPSARILIAGPGEGLELMQSVPPNLRNRLEFLGRLSEEEKAVFLRSIDIYVAPNTGGESFGIILAEAMAAGAAIVASDLPAFLNVLGSGRYGLTFRNEDASDLERQIIRLGQDANLREELRGRAREGARRFDWSEVGPEVMNIYHLARAASERVQVGSEPRSWLRFLTRDEG
ncbi:MAG: glycosyltransferase family 4 protein [Actinobacteria bacterium]|nr:glycosyltransferase family 4 protein [Actinomycetota bacterium]